MAHAKVRSKRLDDDDDADIKPAVRDRWASERAERLAKARRAVAQVKAGTYKAPPPRPKPRTFEFPGTTVLGALMNLDFSDAEAVEAFRGHVSCASGAPPTRENLITARQMGNVLEAALLQGGGESARRIWKILDDHRNALATKTKQDRMLHAMEIVDEGAAKARRFIARGLPVTRLLIVTARRLRATDTAFETAWRDHDKLHAAIQLTREHFAKARTETDVVAFLARLASLCDAFDLGGKSLIAAKPHFWSARQKREAPSKRKGRKEKELAKKNGTVRRRSKG